MAHWYTADPHFGHENVIEFCERPFANSEQMDQVLLTNLCDRVGPKDDLWIVGDFAFGPRAKDPHYLDEIFGQLPGARRHLVVGNHDLRPTLDLPWDSVGLLVELRDGSMNQLNTLCHYPMITWNHARRSALQLFGHVHNNWLGSRNSVNVGVDVWDFAPVHFEEVENRSKTLAPNPPALDTSSARAVRFRCSPMATTQPTLPASLCRRRQPSRAWVSRA